MHILIVTALQSANKKSPCDYFLSENSLDYEFQFFTMNYGWAADQEL